MAKKKKSKIIKDGEEVTSISKEELHNMRFEISIEVPKTDFDEIVKAMLSTNEIKDKS